MLSTDIAEKSRLVLACNGVVPFSSDLDLGVRQLKLDIFKYVKAKIGNIDESLIFEKSYENPTGNISTTSIELDIGSIWVLRLVEPDESTPGRSWVVELSVGSYNQEVLFGCRLQCFSRSYDFEFDHSAPRILKNIVSNSSLVDYGYILRGKALKIEQVSDVDALLALLQHPKRWRNVVVVSCDENYRSLVKYDALAYRLAGIAHIYFITPEASYMFSNKISKELSVFDLGVRIYRANFSEGDVRARHPLFLRRDLESADTLTKRQIDRFIAEESFKASTARENLNRILPSYVDVRSAATKAELARLQEGASFQEKLSAESTARKAAESQVAEAVSLALQEEELRKNLEEERDGYKAQLLAASARIEILESKLSVLHQSLEVGERPKNYAELNLWVENNFPGKLTLHSRAIKALKTANYENIDEVCSIISLLAINYRRVMLGEQRREEFDSELRNFGATLTGSISEGRASESGDEYFIRVDNKRLFLHGHIQKGNSRDDRYCLRIYFLWNATESQILVGWLPSHLKNRLS